MKQEWPIQDPSEASPLGAIRAISSKNARVARRVFERASLSYALVLIGLFSVAFLHDPKMAKASLIAASPFVVAILTALALVLRGLPTRIGAWTLLIATNVVVTIVTIMMGGLAYHSVPLLFFTLCLASGFLSIRDAAIAALSSLAAILVIGAVNLNSDPNADIVVTGPIDVGDSYLIAYLSLLGAFCIAAKVNYDARRAQERRVLEALNRAEHAGVEKTEFFSMVSHEMRTPLNGLVGISEVLAATSDSDAVKARAKAISEQARRLAEAINRVLEMIEKETPSGDLSKKRTRADNPRGWRAAEIAAISYALFFTNMLCLLFAFDHGLAQNGLLASLPFAAIVYATPLLIRRGLRWRAALRLLSWTTLCAVVAMCIAMGGLAFPTAYVLLVLPGIMGTRAGFRDIASISVGCLAGILVIHFATTSDAMTIAQPVITPPGLSWLLAAVTSLFTFVYGNWAAAVNRKKRLTTLQAAVARAENVDEVKAFFLTGVSEQVSTSISVIQQECAALDAAASEKERKLVATLEDSASGFADILNTIQRYADPLPAAVRQEIFQPAEVANEILGEFANKVASDRITVDVISLFEAHATFLGPRSEVEVILRSLVNNAVKFTTIGAIRISVGPSGLNNVAFAVEDTGPGVPPDRIARIFEGFVQGDQSEIRAHGGLGLGLAIARKRARHFGGDVTHAPRPGGGSVFTLTAPLALARSD